MGSNWSDGRTSRHAARPEGAPCFPAGAPLKELTSTGLEHAHRFPEMNINGSANLKALHSAVHERVNNVWTAFRPAGSKASPGEVRQVADIVDQHFQRWYDAVYEQASETALEEAEKAALREVRLLLARLP